MTLMRRQASSFLTEQDRVAYYLNWAGQSDFWRPQHYLSELSNESVSEYNRDVASSMIRGWMRWLDSLVRAQGNGRMTEEQVARLQALLATARPSLELARSAGFSIPSRLEAATFNADV